MSIISELYGENTVNIKRVATDKFFADGTDCRFEGIIDKTAKFIEDFQLLDGEHWARFVRQFKDHTDGADKGWRGEYWGKMMRGACFTYSYTKNPDLKKALTDTVVDMLGAAEEDGRVSSFTRETEFHGWDIWCRKYVLLGMQYFCEISDDEGLNKKIVDFMRGMVDYMISKIGEGKIKITEATDNWRGLNSSSLLEPVVRLYDMTGDEKYLDFATYIIKEGGTSIANIFDIAYEDKTNPYQYPVVKAYEMISCFEGAIEYYRATGEEKYRTAAVNFARRLLETDITIIGSAGCTHEYFDHATARQTDTAYQGIMQETCVTVTWMKFCMQILLLTGDVRFANAYETALYNAYIGSVNTERIVDTFILEKNPDAVLEPFPFDSYSSLLPNTRGRGVGGLKIMPDNHYYGCCACIGSAGIGLVQKMAAMLSKDGIVINLYEQGEITAKTPLGQTVRFTLDTKYPVGDTVNFKLALEQSERFTLTLRIPEWSDKSAVTVCGETTDAPKGYFDITRNWSDGDTLTLTLDMRAKVLHPMSNPVDVIFTTIRWRYDYCVPTVVYESPDAKYHIAITRGPLVLARDERMGDAVDTPVDIDFDSDGIVDLIPSDTADFEKIAEFKVPTRDGKSFTVVDYGSAGKLWDKKYACWLPTKID